MANREISQDELDQLVNDASYLQDEAEAMQYVIDNVPHQKSPPESKSIAELLLLLDYAQLSYYRPILEEAIDSSRPTHLEDFTHFREDFEPDEEKMKDIQKTLRKIAKHRAGLVNAIKNIPLIDWETVVYRDDQQILLFDFMREMVRFERGILKDIAEQVRVFNQDKQSKRELEQRRSQRQDTQPTENS